MDLSSFTKADFIDLIYENSPKPSDTLLLEADRLRRETYGTDVFVRGLIEFTSYCKNNCYYCGIRSQNPNAVRYRLSEQEILACCENGYRLGFKTFVLQGGEDPYFTDDRLCALIYKIKDKFPDCALTLSVGEKSRESYSAFRRAGADRYLLRHETADKAHYSLLHPPQLSLENRKKCLYTLKELGFQTGAGFMVGSPYQKTEYLAEDLIFLRDLQPEMVGIGPFIPHKDSKFHHFPAGDVYQTITMLAIVRNLLPMVLLPATTALGTIHPRGREMGFSAGANVVMPNLSPEDNREAYCLYNNKLHTGAESAEGLNTLRRQIEACGYTMNMGIGHFQNVKNFIK